MLKKGLFTLLLLIITAVPALATQSSSSVPWRLDASGFKNLSTALTSPSTLNKTVIVSKRMTINNKTTNRAIIVIAGGKINIAPGKLITINGTFHADHFQVFEGGGAVRGLKKALPEWFGAKGDALTDDTIALRKWLTSGPSTFELGGADKCYLVGPLVPNEVILPFMNTTKLNGNGATIKVKNNSLEYEAIIGGSSAGPINLDGSIIENIIFDHNGYNNTFSIIGNALRNTHATFQAQNGGNIIFRDNEIQSPVSTNCIIMKSAAGNFKILNNKFINIGANFTKSYDHSTIYLHGPNIEVADNYGSAISGGAFIETHSTKQYVLHNTCVGFQGGMNVTGIYYWGDSEDSVVSGNIIDAKQFGIRILSASYPRQHTTGYGINGLDVYANSIKLHQVNNSVLISKYGMGVGVQPGATLPVKDLKIHDNIITYDLETVATSYGSQHIGIGVMETSTGSVFENIEIFDNKIINSPGPGIMLGMGAGVFKNCNISNNHIINPGQSLSRALTSRYAIWLQGSSYIGSLSISKQRIEDTLSKSRLMGGVYMSASHNSTKCNTLIDVDIFLTGDGTSFTYTAVNINNRLLPLFTCRINKPPKLANHNMKAGSSIVDTHNKVTYKKSITGIAWTVQK